MTERERLIELIENATTTQYFGDEIVRSEMDIDDEDISIIANYLLANGAVILPDIPIGTELYQIWSGKIYKLKLTSYMIREIDGKRVLQWHLHDGRGFNGGGNVDEFGKTVFATREEAEQALKRKEDEE